MISRREYILLALSSILLITLFSACSWLYPLNPWDDANCFTTIAKSMLDGKVLYRDIFDQKGPLLFLIHVASAWAFERPFLGIYFLQILCLFGYLVYSLKTIRLFRQGSVACATLLLIALAGVTSDFYYYGDTVEEFSMPILAYSFYLFLRYARNNELPSVTESLFLGLGYAAVFWMKFTVLAMPLGSLLVALVLVCIRRQWRQILPVMGGMILGFFFLTTLILLIFVPQQAVGDVMDGYFGYNLFHYHLYNEDTPSDMGFYPLRWLLFILLVTPICFVKTKPAVKWMVVVSWAFSLVLMAVTTVYIYYFLVLFIFPPLLVKWIPTVWNKTRVALCVVLAAIFVGSSFNFVTLCRGTFPHAILNVVRSLEDEPDDTPILQYHTRETGLYTYSRFSVPVCIFFQLSVVHQDYLDEQEAELNSDCCSYVIMKDGRLNHPDYVQIGEYPEPFRALLFVHPQAWLYQRTGLKCLKPLDVENAIPTVRKATISTFRLYRRR